MGITPELKDSMMFIGLVGAFAGAMAGQVISSIARGEGSSRAETINVIYIPPIIGFLIGVVSPLIVDALS